MHVSDEWLRAYERAARRVGVVKPQRAVALWRGRYAVSLRPMASFMQWLNQIDTQVYIVGRR